MDENDAQSPLDPPQVTWVDHCHQALMVGANVWTGGIGGTILSAVVGPPLEKRRLEFERDVAERIAKLEQQCRVNREELSKNQQFISTYVQATLAAVGTQNERKRAALRNAIVSSALPEAPDETRQHLYVRWIDELTEMHLRVLEWSRESRSYPRDGAEAVAHQFPELKPLGLSEVIVAELIARKLLKSDPEPGTVYVQRETVRLTTLGSNFLAFIRDPV